ncbi:MAG TPA: glycosyltransferase [Nitrososphaera sp.]|nr:glycosyltransferase [Nitrososphaera sp.]
MSPPNEPRAKVEVEDTSPGSSGSQDSASQYYSHQNQFYVRCEQQVSPDGKIKVSKKGWVIRITTIVGISLIALYNLYEGFHLRDPLIVYSTLMPLHALLVFTFGWLFYRSPAKGPVGDDLVSVIIPVYNQKEMIEIVIDAIYQSTYKNIEVVVVNDGSKDGTKEVLDELARKYPQLKVIHKKNEGKRKAVATGFFNSKGGYVVLIDSDSVVDKHAITEFMKAFKSDPKIGAVVGYAKVWNANKNFLTKCQDAWYDYAFNIHKTCESAFGNVMCCSGCLAGYRREAIADFIPHWVRAKIHNSDDRDLTSYAIAAPWAKRQLAPRSKLSDKLAIAMANYDDSEDRALTAHAIVEWKAVYVASAIVYTDVPEKIKSYLRQQKRWKKGYIRSNFYVSSFFWQKNPIISLIFYTEFMATFTSPLITLIVFFYEPFILGEFWLPVIFLTGSLLTGLAQGFDYKFRDKSARNWKYKPIMNLISTFVLSWMIFPALWNYRRNEWLTR